MSAALTAEQVAERLNRRVEWVRQAAAAETIPAFKVGSLWRFDPEDIERWVDRHRNAPADPLAMTALSQKRQGAPR